MVKIQAPFRFSVLLTFNLTMSAVASARVSGVGDDATSKTAVRGETITPDSVGRSAVAPAGVMSSDFRRH